MQFPPTQATPLCSFMISSKESLDRAMQIVNFVLATNQLDEGLLSSAPQGATSRLHKVATTQYSTSILLSGEHPERAKTDSKL